ncbi:MAG: hypothetical protein Q3966_07940 [Neisseria sp.]|nr:hypothetical protein [Neisseria sp.]
MKLNRPFNTLTLAEYRALIPRHTAYADFNPLGLFRSIVENRKLDQAAKQKVLALAKQYFPKFYAFLPAKDPQTYFELSLLGQPPLSDAQWRQYYWKIRERGEKIAKGKGIRNHRVGSMTKSQWMSVSRKHPEQGIRTVWVMNRHSSDKARCSGRTRPPHLQRRKHESEEIREIWREYV